MVRRLAQLPRNYYKRRTPPPALRPPERVFTATWQANFGSIGPGRNQAVGTLRKILLQDVATSIVNETRAAHINVTMDAWRKLRSKGYLDDEVAILVDGSPQRPIKNVKFAGRIDIQSPVSTALIAEAARAAWDFMRYYSAVNRGPTSGDMRKKGKMGRPFRYSKNFRMFISDKTQVTDPATLERSGVLDRYDYVTIVNDAPYAAKLERYRYPQGTFVQTFKRLRKIYGSRIAIRFDYVESTTTTQKQSGGGAVPQPVIRIGQPGAFPSRMPNIKKFIRDEQKRRRNRGRV